MAELLATIPEPRVVGVRTHGDPSPRESHVRVPPTLEPDILPLWSLLCLVLQGRTVPARVSSASVRMWLPISPGGMAACLRTQTTFT